MELFAAGGHLLAPRVPVAIAWLVGIVIHAAWMLHWAVSMVALARHDRGIRASVEGTVVATVAFAVSVVLPGAVLGPVATLTIGERALVHVVLALSLILGIRLAFAGDRQVA